MFRIHVATQVLETAIAAGANAVDDALLDPCEVAFGGALAMFSDLGGLLCPLLALALLLHFPFFFGKFIFKFFYVRCCVSPRGFAIWTMPESAPILFFLAILFRDSVDATADTTGDRGQVC